MTGLFAVFWAAAWSAIHWTPHADSLAVWPHDCKKHGYNEHLSGCIRKNNPVTHLRIWVECTEVQSRDLKIGNKVDTNTRCIRISRRISLLEPSLVTNSHKMVRVDGFNVSADRRSPLSNGGSSGIASRGSASGGSWAARFVGQLPSHDRRFINISTNEVLDIVFVSCDHLSIGVESIVSSTGVKLRNVDVHSTVVGPVVGQCHDETDAMSFCRLYNVVKSRDTEVASIEGGNTVLPELVVGTEVLGRCDVIESPRERMKSQWKFTIQF